MTLKDYYESFIQVKEMKYLTKEYYLKALEYYKTSKDELINPEIVLGFILFKRRDKLEKFVKTYNYTLEDLEAIIKNYIYNYAPVKELIKYLAGDTDEHTFLNQFVNEIDRIDMSQKYGLNSEQIAEILKYHSRKQAQVILKDEQKSKAIWQDIKSIQIGSSMNIVDIFNLYAKEHHISPSLVKITYYLHEETKEKEKSTR